MFSGFFEAKDPMNPTFSMSVAKRLGIAFGTLIILLLLNVGLLV